MTNTVKAKAKINLFLHVISCNENNYHNLESMVAFADDIYDIISIKPSNSLYLTMDGPFSNGLSATDNLILKAAFCLQNYTNSFYGAHIHLTKNIPLAAGLGGGSSDATAVLKLLNNFWKLYITDFTLYNICAKLGSDVPVCHYGKYSYFSGKGEIITPIEATCPKIYALLINPLIATSTQTVFYNLREEKFSKPFLNWPKSFLHALELIEFLKIQKNDLDESATKLVPEINDIINVLNSQNGCILSRLSGSGATCFGLFISLEEAKYALTNIQRHHGNWWSDVTLLS